MTDTGQCRKVIDREAYANENAIPLRVSAGSVVLFSAMLWHHSRGNQTDRVRRAFIVSYQEATVPKGAGEQWKIVRLAAGQPPSRRRAEPVAAAESRALPAR